MTGVSAGITAVDPAPLGAVVDVDMLVGGRGRRRWMWREERRGGLLISDLKVKLAS